MRDKIARPAITLPSAALEGGRAIEKESFKIYFRFVCRVGDQFATQRFVPEV